MTKRAIEFEFPPHKTCIQMYYLGQFGESSHRRTDSGSPRRRGKRRMRAKFERGLLQREIYWGSAPQQVDLVMTPSMLHTRPRGRQIPLKNRLVLMKRLAQASGLLQARCTHIPLWQWEVFRKTPPSRPRHQNPSQPLLRTRFDDGAALAYC